MDASLQFVSKRPSLERRRHVDWSLWLALIAWIGVFLLWTSGVGPRLTHDRLIHSSLGLPEAEVLFLSGWILMIVAMMLPAAAPAIGVASRTRKGAPVFIGMFVLVWIVFGAALFLGDVGVHAAADRFGWLGAHPWLIGAVTLLIAGFGQLVPMKSRCLALCREPVRLWDPPAPTAVYAKRYAMACIGCDGPLMLVMFGAGLGHLAWMAGLAGVMRYEVSGRRPHAMRYSIAVMLIVWAVFMAFQPHWLPRLLSSLT